ncbi:hypothetical protein CYY_006022 [Polysphondylium violaceum]|uniref:Uncharacterized protein n=1 Tax=Polysphondylium violaceum TaxID=133409 RepID=A0A8J4V3K6_9MYCE|nr:hypothetical protein CYY_006022 [Polysphondylium violaceum]
MNLNVYEVNKAVKKVKSLSTEDLSTGSNLGVLPLGISVLLSQNHVEFTVILEGKKSSEVVWLGFYFSGSFLKFQKIFKKSIENASFENIEKIIHKSLITKLEDPYSCPMYITGSNDSKAYFTISNSNTVLGHIPLHRSDTFHTLQSYPILYLENDIQVVIGTDLDRNQLFPSYSKVDTSYSSTLRNIDTIFSQNKWSATVIPVIKEEESLSPPTSTTVPTPTSTANPTTPTPASPNETPATTTPTPTNTNNSGPKSLLTKNQFDLEKLSRWFIKKFNSTSPLTFVYGVSLYRKSTQKTMDLLTLKTLSTGKTYIVNLVHTFRLTPSLDFFKNSEMQKNFENEHLSQYLTSFTNLEKDCQAIKTLFPTSSISIYNPFFEKHTRKVLKCSLPLAIESTFFASNHSISSSLSGNNNSNSNNNTTTTTSHKPTTNIVDPIPISSSATSSVVSTNNNSSLSPFVSISSATTTTSTTNNNNTNSSSNSSIDRCSPSSTTATTTPAGENILDKFKNIEKKFQSVAINNNNPKIDVEKLSLIVGQTLKSYRK